VTPSLLLFRPTPTPHLHPTPHTLSPHLHPTHPTPSPHTPPPPPTEATLYPVAMMPDGKGMFPEDHAQYIGACMDGWVGERMDGSSEDKHFSKHLMLLNPATHPPTHPPIHPPKPIHPPTYPNSQRHLLGQHQHVRRQPRCRER